MWSVLSASVVLALLLATPGKAQGWRGGEKLSGVVLDSEERPLAGARVEIAWGTEGAQGPEPRTTDERGRFAFLNLAPGLWRTVVSADGHVRSEGSVQVGGASGDLRIVLRSLDEVAPTFAENRASVMGWLERGDSLLQQGQQAAARVEYEKALAVMPAASQPPVWRAVARSHLEERNTEDAVTALEKALLAVPDDESTRRAFVELMAALDRSAAAEAWLAELPEAAPPPPPPPPRGLRMRLDDGIVPESPQPGRAGHYRVAFDQPSPLAELDVFLERYGLDRTAVLESDPQAGHLDLSRESFEVMVPANAPVAASDEPWGLLVWVSPTASGIPRRSFTQVLAEQRVIWVGANDSGNPRPVWDRIALALAAVQNLSALYPIDPERVWVSGWSGGGRVASALAVLYPEVFHGGLFVHGCNFYREVPDPSRPGMVWPAGFEAPPWETRKPVRQRNRYVFLTAEHDFNRLQTREVERRYKGDGFRHTRYLEIPGGDHYVGLPAPWLERALDWLDR